MKSFSVTIRETLGKGLAPKSNLRNQPFLVESLGAVPYNKALQTLTSFTAIDTSGLGALTFPYPQLFVCPNFIIVCTATAIYEYTGGSLVLQISGLTTGTPWSLDSEKDYIILSNMQQTVIRDPVSKVYSVSAALPTFSSICNYNGQMVIGSVNQLASGTI